MRQRRKEILEFKAKLTKRVIIQHREDLEKGGTIELEFIRSEIKDAKTIFYHELGEDLIKYVEFKQRKRTKDEIHLLLTTILLYFFPIYLVFIIAIIFMGLGDNFYISVIFYLVHAMAFVYGLYHFTDSMKKKWKMGAMLGFLMAVTNGIVMLENLLIIL